MTTFITSLEAIEGSTNKKLVLLKDGIEIGSGLYDGMEDAYWMKIEGEVDGLIARLFQTPEDLLTYMALGAEEYYARKAA
jgi:hypothetical protein